MVPQKVSKLQSSSNFKFTTTLQWNVLDIFNHRSLNGHIVKKKILFLSYSEETISGDHKNGLNMYFSDFYLENSHHITRNRKRFKCHMWSIFLIPKEPCDTVLNKMDVSKEIVPVRCICTNATPFLFLHVFIKQ